jgi:nucleoid DNA-binding protein
MNKTEIIKSLSESTGLEKKQVQAVLDSLGNLIASALKVGGPGSFKLQSLAQFKRIDKPAQPARQGIDPFTKKEREFAAKPAKSVVKIIPLKDAKEAVQ